MYDVFSLFAGVNPYSAAHKLSIDQPNSLQQNSCSSYINVINQQVNGTFNFYAIIGVYNRSQFNYTASPITNQKATNYYNQSIGSSYSNGRIYGIALPDGTGVVILGKDTQGHVYFMDNWCQNNLTYGVQINDSFTYTYTTSSTQKSPFFGLDNNTPIISNGNTVKITVSKIVDQNSQPPTSIILSITIGTNLPFQTNDSMFLIVPLEFIGSLLNGTFSPGPNGGPVPKLVTSTPMYAIIDMFSPQGNMTVIYDRNHGNLLDMNGTFLDPYNHIITLGLSLIYSPYGNPYNNQNVFPQYHQWAVNKGDSLTYTFSTTATNPFSFFGYNNNQAFITNGETITIEVLNSPTNQTNSPLALQMTIGNNASFESNDSAFFVVPIDMLNSVINGTYTSGPNDNGPNPYLITSNESIATIGITSQFMNATLQFNRQHGTLVSLSGNTFDSQNNSIQINLVLIQSNLSNSANSNTLTISTPGFDLVTLLFMVSIVVVIKKKKFV